jgi:uncharacterized membrane protein
MQTIFLAGTALPIMLVLDLTWVGVVANKYYRSQLGSLFTKNIQVWPVVLFYIIYVFALSYFVIHPAVAEHSVWRAAGGGPPPRPNPNRTAKKKKN